MPFSSSDSITVAASVYPMPGKRCIMVNYHIQNSIFRIAETYSVTEPKPHVHFQMLTTSPKAECIWRVATHNWNYLRIIKVKQNKILAVFSFGYGTQWNHNKKYFANWSIDDK